MTIREVGAVRRIAGQQVPPGEVGQAQVEDDHVGPVAGGELGGLDGGGRLADHLEAAMAPQGEPQEPAYVVRVVDEQDGDASSLPPGAG